MDARSSPSRGHCRYPPKARRAVASGQGTLSPPSPPPCMVPPPQADAQSPLPRHIVPPDRVHGAPQDTEHSPPKARARSSPHRLAYGAPQARLQSPTKIPRINGEERRESISLGRTGSVGEPGPCEPP